MVSADQAEELSQLRKMRAVSLLEGTTLLLLIGVAVPLKHLAGYPIATRVMGPVHGVTTADCVAMAILEFADQFYGISLPADCPKLVEWYSRMCERPSGQAPAIPRRC